MRVVSDKERKAIGEFFEQMRDAARQNFERDGACEPVAILLRDGETAVIPLRPLINQKDLASAILNQAIEVIRPLAFVLVTEAWMACAGSDAAAGDGMADLPYKYQGSLTEPVPGGQEKPKAGVKEVVMLQCASVTGDNFTLTADIVRTEGSKPVLKPWARMENTRAKGRFIFDVTPLAERQ